MAEAERRRVFVLLPDHLDVAAWRERWRAGLAPDETPYGYHHAQEFGYDVYFSEPLRPRAGWAALPFKVLRRLLGFDVEHAWNHRDQLFGGATQVIWTHTEREFLPILWLGMVLGKRLPPMIAQIVWLADEWPRMSAWRRAVQGWLMKHRLVGKATCHSPVNLPFLRNLLGADRSALVPFGIAPELYAPQSQLADVASQPMRLLVMGNDRHRDWQTLHDAFANDAEVELFIASSTYPDHLLSANMVRQSCDLPAIRERLAWCDAVVVPVVPNLHVSGMTVSLEAVACGKPLVVSDTGGLRHFFDERHAWLVPAGDARRLHACVHDLMRKYADARTKVDAARERFRELQLDTRGYASRHVAISEALLREA